MKTPSIVAIVLTLLVGAPGQSAAQDSQLLGLGRLFSNDYMGDGRDRWRSGAYTLSFVQGREWEGQRPENPASLLEYRLRSETINPAAGTSDTMDRPYVGMLAVGLHSHSAVGATEFSIGADVVFVGPQTRVSAFQQRFHDRFGLPEPRGTDTQVEDATRLHATGEIAHRLEFSPGVMLRPFVEVQAGAEDLLRVGADVVLGRVGRNSLLLRDNPTGQLYRGIDGRGSGLSFIGGVDAAMVQQSLYLPAARGYAAEDMRFRVRGGIHWQIGPRSSVFYGLTYLSEEFVGQPEGQVTGSLKVAFLF